MTVFAGALSTATKELGELLRKRRLLGLLLVVGLLLAVPYSVLLWQGGREPLWNLLTPVVFVGPLVLMVVAVVFAADLVSKEVEGHTLALLTTSPTSPAGVLLGKLAAPALAYVAMLGFVLLFFLPFALGHGLVMLEIILWLFLVPFLAFYVFATGLAVLLSVVTGTTRASFGGAFAAGLTLLFLMQEPPGLGFLFEERFPALWELLAYNPFQVAMGTGQDLLYGVPFPWFPLLLTLAMGLVLHGAAFALFQRVEVDA